MPTSTEINPLTIADALKRVHDQKSFLNDLLAETLNWPVAAGVSDVGDISFEWSETDLRARDLSKKLVDGKALQVQLTTDQPWGIFILEFKNPDVFTSDRGMTGILRQVLRGLVKSRNKAGSLPSWQRENLLFICTHKYTHFRIAHFKAPKEDGRTARLAAFGWGPDIPARTACEFNLNHLGWPSSPDRFDQWAEAFNVEKVTKKFYGEYKTCFDALRDSVTGLGSGTEDQKMFTQTLLNRLMFLRFIERKGWLNPPGDPDNRDYLRILFEAGNVGKKSFYLGRLHDLFFKGLAVEGEQELKSIGKVPFLNGGLFEKNDLDKKVDDIPNTAFAPLLGPEGLFYRYNFTVQESTPLDVEVAVDPEMLGKVFEELVTGRHESGSYYTPRPIVSFMCREALKGYLTDVTKLPDPTVAAFVDKHDTTAIGIPDAQSLVTALNNLKAVDPACGSGAYLLGLLHEMVDLYRLLYSDKLKSKGGELHKLKLRIISNSIYGVDIDKFATNIAMLRLWLSLSVDSEIPLPLPNLDFKIETGDSLAGPDPSIEPDSGGSQAIWQMRRWNAAQELVAKKAAFLDCHDGTKAVKKVEIVLKQDALAMDLAAELGPGVIDWRVHFAEAFSPKPAEATVDGRFAFVNDATGAQRSFLEPIAPAGRPGFDIVLANPPYVRQELIKDQKPALKKVYGSNFSGTADLYVFFYLRALQCLRPGGMLAFISSNKWFRAGYGKKLREHIAKTASVQTILDFHDLPVFESAIAYPMIFVARNGSPADSPPAVLAEPPTLDPPYPDVVETVKKFGIRLPISAIGPDGVWNLTSQAATDSLVGVKASGRKIADMLSADIYYGLKTGLSKVFLVDADTRQRLIARHPSSAELLVPFAAGRDIKRWTVDPVRRWLILTKIGTEITRYPAIFEYLQTHEKALKSRDDQGNHWWELRPCSYYHIFESSHIVYQAFQVKPAFAIAPPGLFSINSTYVIASGDLYLLAVLNSAPFWSEIRRTCSLIRGGYQLMYSYFSQAIIPHVGDIDRKAIAALAQKCLDAKGVGCEAWEAEIDERVAALYGL